MKFRVVAVGNKMPAWVNAACGEYMKRIASVVELIEIKPEKRHAGKSVAQISRAEAARILAALPRDSLRVVLDEHGDAWSTQKLATHMARWMREGKSVSFIVGGADGLSEELKRDAKMFSLSALTLPHALARVVLIEQLYRAFSILDQHPYHRD